MVVVVVATSLATHCMLRPGRARTSAHATYSMAPAANPSPALWTRANESTAMKEANAITGWGRLRHVHHTRVNRRAMWRALMAGVGRELVVGVAPGGDGP